MAFYPSQIGDRSRLLQFPSQIGDRNRLLVRRKCIESAGCKSLSKLGLNFVTESNCVLVRGGGEQLEVNGWSVG